MRSVSLPSPSEGLCVERTGNTGGLLPQGEVRVDGVALPGGGRSGRQESGSARRRGSGRTGARACGASRRDRKDGSSIVGRHRAAAPVEAPPPGREQPGATMAERPEGPTSGSRTIERDSGRGAATWYGTTTRRYIRRRPTGGIVRHQAASALTRWQDELQGLGSLRVRASCVGGMSPSLATRAPSGRESLDPSAGLLPTTHPVD